jgi:hypothetical protein
MIEIIGYWLRTEHLDRLLEAGELLSEAGVGKQELYATLCRRAFRTQFHGIQARLVSLQIAQETWCE